MRIAVIGAGGIGCYYGAKLADNNDVVFVARGEHLAAMQAKGLFVSHPDFTFDKKVTACSLDELITQYIATDFDLLLICIKATATEEIALVLKDWIRNESDCPYVLSLQNGMGNEQILAEHLYASRIIGGFAVRIGADVTQPAHVSVIGVAQIVMGFWPNSQAVNTETKEVVSSIDAVFNQAAIPTRTSDDIRKELWRKLMINNALNPLGTLLKKDTGFLTHHKDYAVLIKKIMIEAATASRSDGSNLDEADIDEMFQLIYEFDAIKPSMLIDREKGRTLELDEICGAVIRGCEQMGEDAPYTRTIYTLLKNLED